jgi:hypothetical protein
VCAGIGWWNERPQTFGMLALVAAVVVVTEGRRARWLVPLFAVWIGVHGSWIVGIALVGLVAIGSDRRGAPRRATTYGCAALLGVLIGAAASPYGMELVAFPFRLASRGSQLAAFREWQRPGLLQVGTLLVVALAVVAVLGARRERSWRWLPLLVAVGVLAAQAQRNLPIAALALVPATVPFLAALGGDRAAEGPSRRSVLWAGVAVAVLVALAVAATSPHYDLAPYPVDLVQRLDQRGWIGSDEVRLVAPDWVGNYLDWRDGAEASVFVDDRAEVFPARVHEDHLTLLRGGPGWDLALDRWDAGVVLWPSADRLAERLAADPVWREVAGSDGFVAFCRIGAVDGC